MDTLSDNSIYCSGSGYPLIPYFFAAGFSNLQYGVNIRHAGSTTPKDLTMQSRHLLISFVLLSLFLPLASPVLSAPKANLWERWLAHDPDSSITVDHTPWDQFLKTYIIKGSDGINRVAYGKLTEADRIALARYIDKLTKIPVSKLSRSEQLPYWINLYNALTVQVILEHYPVKSIQDIDISPGFFVSGPWDKKLVHIEGKAVSLNDIEHRILRPIWKDPRIHYAVNCASIGCPNLRDDAFTRKNTETLFENGAHDYINHPRGVKIEEDGLTVSSIYMWFSEDFGGTDASIISHLKQYATPVLREKLNRFTRISDHHYDWSLNDAP